jgi:hypothetical protein
MATAAGAAAGLGADVEAPAQEPKVKKSRTNTPWTPAEEQRLKTMRDAGNSWSEIAKVNMHSPMTHKPVCASMHILPNWDVDRRDIGN